MFYGSLEGRPISETRSDLTALSEAWAAGRTNVAVGGDGESPDDLIARAHGALWANGRAGTPCLLGRTEAGRHVAVIAHSTFNKAVLAVAMGKGLGSMFGIPQDNACVNVIDFKVADGAMSVVATNITPDPSHDPSST